MRTPSKFARVFTLVAAAGMPMVGGSCASSHDDRGSMSAVQGIAGQDANALNAEHSTFDAVKDPPFTADTRFAAGRLAESQGQLEAAVQQYREAVKINPRHLPSLYQLGVIYTKAQQYPQAIEAWRQYVKASDGSGTAYSNLAFCLDLAGQTANAEEAYKTGVRNEPNNEPCRVNYGLFLARHGRSKDAIEQLATVLKPAEVHYNLASVYEQIGRKDEARSEYERAIELDPQLWEAKSRLANLE
jgi:tetratricopeptide (TPR) repeat protein